MSPVIPLVALWLGVVTSLHPCPMAANVAALAFLASRAGPGRRLLLGGAMYAAGRAATYVALSAGIAAGMLAIPEVSRFCQDYLNKLLGPALILVGMVLLEMLPIPGRTHGDASTLTKSDRGGLWLALLLGVVLALSFCPISAVLFFGSLIPLCLQQRSYVLLPLAYGVGTALPALLLAALAAAGTDRLGKTLDRLKHVQHITRLGTGLIIIAVGVYYCLAFIFEVLPV